MQAFLAQWAEQQPEDAAGVRRAFEELAGVLKDDGAVTEFVPRPGVTYSLRASGPQQSERPIFGMVDVIDDDPAARWLSVCFYADFVTDPDEIGDEVPGGLMGNDARCFDLDEYEPERLAYLAARLREGLANCR